MANTAKRLDENGVLYLWQKIKSIFATQSDLNTLSGRVDEIVSTGYQTASDVSSAINNALAGITGISFEVVTSLPSTGTAGTIYLISNSGSGTNSYDEYIYVSNKWERLGTTDVDLSSYYNTSNLIAITNAEIDAIVAS